MAEESLLPCVTNENTGTAPSRSPPLPRPSPLLHSSCAMSCPTLRRHVPRARRRAAWSRSASPPWCLRGLWSATCSGYRWRWGRGGAAGGGARAGYGRREATGSWGNVQRRRWFKLVQGSPQQQPAPVKAWSILVRRSQRLVKAWSRRGLLLVNASGLSSVKAVSLVCSDVRVVALMADLPTTREPTGTH